MNMFMKIPLFKKVCVNSNFVILYTIDRIDRNRKRIRNHIFKKKASCRAHNKKNGTQPEGFTKKTCGSNDKALV